MKALKLLFLLFFFTNFVNAQKVIAEEFYQGTINEKLNVSLYLKTQETGCPSTVVDAIYKYDNNKINNWILLDVTFSEKNNRYTFVEYNNTGVLLLKKENGILNGYWISPDGEKKLKVNLKKVKTTKAKITELNEKLEYEKYITNDC